MDEDSILTVTCAATRYTWAIPVPDLTATTTLCAYIEGFVVHHGHPLEIFIDCHGSFKDVFQQYCTAHGVRMHPGKPYHPQGQARGERPHQTIRRKLRASLANNSHNWRPILAHVMQAVNTAKHSAMGVSPYEALFGRTARTDAATALDTSTPFATLAQHQALLEYMHEIVHECELRHNIVQRDHLEEAMLREGHAPHVYKPGDTVALFFPDRVDKNHYHHKAGYRIKSLTPKPGVYIVEELDPSGTATSIGEVPARRLMPISMRRSKDAGAAHQLKEDHHVIESITGHLIHPVPPGSPTGTTPTVTFKVRWDAGPAFDDHFPRLGDLMRNCKHLLEPYLLLHPDIKSSWLLKQRTAENKLDRVHLKDAIVDALTLPPAAPAAGPHRPPVAPAPAGAPPAAQQLQPQ